MGPSRRDHLLLPGWGRILLSSLPCPKKAELPSSEDSMTWELPALSPFELLVSTQGQLPPSQVGGSGSLRVEPSAALFDAAPHHCPGPQLGCRDSRKSALATSVPTLLSLHSSFSFFPQKRENLVLPVSAPGAIIAQVAGPFQD